MLDFLREILGEAYTEDIGKQVSERVGKDFVSRADFNVANEAKKQLEKQVKDHEKQLGTLKDQAKGSEELQNKIDTLQQATKEWETKYKEGIKAEQVKAEAIRKEYNLKEMLSREGVVDPDYLIYRHGGVDKFAFDGDSKPIGVADTLQAYKEDRSLGHLFKSSVPSYDPKNGGIGGADNPFAKDTFNLTKQGELLRVNPEQARAMAAAAGVTI